MKKEKIYKPYKYNTDTFVPTLNELLMSILMAGAASHSLKKIDKAQKVAAEVVALYNPSGKDDLDSDKASLQPREFAGMFALIGAAFSGKSAESILLLAGYTINLANLDERWDAESAAVTERGKNTKRDGRLRRNSVLRPPSKRHPRLWNPSL